MAATTTGTIAPLGATLTAGGGAQDTNSSHVAPAAFVELAPAEDGADLVATVYPAPITSTTTTSKFGGTSAAPPRHASILDLRRAKSAAGAGGGRKIGSSFAEVHDAYYDAAQEATEFSIPPALASANSADFPFKHPQSFYGPYFERVHAASTSLKDAPPTTKSFQDMCRESLVGAQNSHGGSTLRPWASQWTRAWSMPTATLATSGARLHRLTSIAEDFAAYAGTVAQRIVEELPVAASQRVVKPVPGFEHTMLFQGNVFTLATAKPFADLHGSRAAAYRAARNEVRAVRTLLAAYHVEAMPALCACVTYAGVTVFASAPVAAGDPSSTFAHGAPHGARGFQCRPDGGSIASELGNFIPLQRHVVPLPADRAQPESPTPSGDDDESQKQQQQQQQHQPSSEPVSTTLPFDMKLVRSSRSNVYVALDCARLMPPAVCALEFSKYASREDQLGNKNLCRHPLENEPRAHLNVCFRPEFMRRSCPLQLNVDAGTSGQPASAGENIGYAVMTLHSKCLVKVRQALMSECLSRSLPAHEIVSTLHEHGVNLRYLGRIARAIRATLSAATSTGGRTAEAREALVRTMELEMTARTFKSLLYDQLAAADHRPGEADSIIIAHVKNLVMASGSEAAMYWDHQLVPEMKRKFDYECHVVMTLDEVMAAEASGASATSGETVRAKDPTSLHVYRAINSAKKRVETVPCPLKWVETAPGCMSLAPKPSADAAAKEEEEEGQPPAHTARIVDAASSEGTSHAALYPLIGPTARANRVLLHRALELVSVELRSDMRGKRIFVTPRPNTRSCTAIVVSSTAMLPTASTLLVHAPKAVSTALALSVDDPSQQSLWEAVQEAAEDEAAHFGAIAESDPRSQQCLQPISRCAMRLGLHTRAHQAQTKLFDLRRSAKDRWSAGAGMVLCGEEFITAQRWERAEAAFVEGITAIHESAGESIESEAASVWVLRAAKAIGEVVASGQLQLPVERIAHTLDYFTFALAHLEKARSPLVADALVGIARLRRYLLGLARCCNCGKQATCVIPSLASTGSNRCGDDDELSTIDAHSALGGGTVKTAAMPSRGDTAATAQNTNTKRGVAARRRRDDGGRQGNNRKQSLGVGDEQGQQADIFTRHTLPPIANWLAPPVASSSTPQSRPLPAATSSPAEAQQPLDGKKQPSGGGEKKEEPTKKDAASKTSAKTAEASASAAAASSSQQTAGTATTTAATTAVLPTPVMLSGILTTRQCLRGQVYFCDGCGVSAAMAGPGEPARKRDGILIDVARLLTRAVGVMRRLAADGQPRPEGDALLGSALVELGSIRGDASLIAGGIVDLRAVYGDLARPAVDASIQLAQVLFARSLIPNPPVGGHSRDVGRLQACEDVVSELLTAVLAKSAASPPSSPAGGGPLLQPTPSARRNTSGAMEGSTAEGVEKLLSATQRTTTAVTTSDIASAAAVAAIVEVYLNVLVAYGDLPAAKREHAGIHAVVNTLSKFLAATDPLVGKSLNLAARYYLKIAAFSAEGSAQRSTALHTAAGFAQRYVECVTAGPEPALVVAAIGIIRDDIVRPLRGSINPADRAAATKIASECKYAVSKRYAYTTTTTPSAGPSALGGTMGSMAPDANTTNAATTANFATATQSHAGVQTALTQLDDVFKAQPKVVEESAQSAAFSLELSKLRSHIQDAVARIRRHDDRGDAYCRRQMARIVDARDRALEITKAVRDTACKEKARAVIRLHDEVTGKRKRRGSGADVGASGDDAEVADEGASGNGVPPEAGSTAPPSPSSPSAYVSPYACLPDGFERDEGSLESMRPTSGLLESHGGAHGDKRHKPRLALGSHALPADVASRDKATVSNLRKAHTQLALAASKKTFSRTAANMR